MNKHDNNNHILDISHCHMPFKIISENVSWDLLLQKESGSAETFFLDIGEYKFVRIQILMKYFKDVSKTLGGDETVASGASERTKPGFSLLCIVGELMRDNSHKLKKVRIQGKLFSL